MSITAIVVNYNYAKYLPECLESCIRFCDEVRVFDDCSTDDSLEVIRRYHVPCVQNTKNSGGPVWGSNKGIKKVVTTHFMYVDADNFLLKKPTENDVDYTFGNIALANERGHITGLWKYSDRPTMWRDALAYWARDPRQIPVPWGGVWRTEFVKSNNLKWRDWHTKNFAPDMRTCIEWLQHKPTLHYEDKACLAFRQHENQLTSFDTRRVAVEVESCRLAASIGETLRSPG